VNVGLIGCGRIAADHLMIYRQIKDANVVAVSDVDLQRARLLADKNGVDRVFKDYSDLLELKDLDFVDVCTPPSTHAAIVCDAAQHGRNVLVEKPMALSTDECDKMILEAEKHKVSLCVCHNQVFFPAMTRAKQLIDSGVYDVVSFRTSVKENPGLYGVPAWNTSAREKGIIWEVGCHPAYLQLHFLRNVTEVYAVGNKVRHGVFDEFSVLLRTSDRAYGIIELSWLAKETEKIYEFDCADGKRAFMISPPPTASRGYETLVERSGITESSSLRSEVQKLIQHFTRRETSLGYFAGHFHLISRYVKSLREGSVPPVKPEDGKRAVRLLECIEKSLNTHETVALN
jgi:UDP-N-acetylglucosamine 3-dehydrogenase